MTQKNKIPLVKDATRSQSESIQTVVSRLQNGEIYVPDYQRGSDQWNLRKKSLLIESTLNNLTIPAFFLCEDENGNSEVIDGQQRLTIIREYAEDKFKISDSNDIEYLLPEAVQYRGKKISELPNNLQKVFNKYPLSIIFLPASMSLSIKLEVFRRINEGGTPLTGQDIRLAYYKRSNSVYFIRLAGIHSDSESAQRMIEEGKNRKGIAHPWDEYSQAREEWDEWWRGKSIAKGQTPSLMFLWYLICLERNRLGDMLNAQSGTNHLKINFRGTIEESLDIYYAQIQYQEIEADSVDILSNIDTISNNYFPSFAKWIYKILSSGIPGISVDKYKQLALFIAAAVEMDLPMDDLSDEQWNWIGEFIRRPRKTGREILSDSDDYPEPKGRWTTARGQKQQCEKTIEIVRNIMDL